MLDAIRLLGGDTLVVGLATILALLVGLVTVLRWIREGATWTLSFQKKARERYRANLERAKKDLHFFLAYCLSEGLFHIGVLAYGAGLLAYAWFLTISTVGILGEFGTAIASLIGLLAIGFGLWQILAVSEFAWKVLEARQATGPEAAQEQKP